MDIFEEVARFYEEYRGEKMIYGRSERGRPLFAMRIGKDGAVGISQYAIHAREWVTALLALEHIRRGLKTGSVWVLPLTNPDGAVLACTEAPLWKANADGVDLNVNFPARWGKGASNVFAPAAENFVGRAPLCARESRALADVTLKLRPRFTVSWHTKGEEIYWRFHQPLFRRMRDKKFAKILSEATGYPLREAKNSAGGYKDWCVERLKIPAFTVEAGSDELSHPLGREALPAIVNKTADALERLTEVF